MQRRFFVEQHISNSEIEIQGPDAHHILNVNRLGVEDSVTLFDGSGKEFTAKIREVAKKRLTVEIVDTLQISRETDIELMIGVALPKGDRQKVLVEKMTELGVSMIIPIHCQRSVVQLKEKSLDRLRRWVIESSKQCGRNVLMDVGGPVGYMDFLAHDFGDAVRLVAHPYGQSLSIADATNSVAKTGRCVVAIGPEGGFSDTEVRAAAAAGWRSFSLGHSILRVETAAAAVAAIFGIGQTR